MTNLIKKHFFFFYEDCSSIIIKPNTLEHAYLCIINDNLSEAKKIFEGQDSPRSRWGNVLISILEGFMTHYPTFFQIRNFLEIDIDFLLKNNKIDYVEKLLYSAEYLANINQETYKFIARVMYANCLYSAAMEYMERSKNLYYNDAELHFMYAKYYIKCNKLNDALFHINECLKLIPEYYPAITMKEKIEEMFV